MYEPQCASSAPLTGRGSKFRSVTLCSFNCSSTFSGHLVGLACRLQGWSAPDQIITSPQQGPLFENLVFSEIYKLNLNYQLGWNIYHWRSKDKEEIDFLIDRGPKGPIFIEVKVSAQPLKPLTSLPEVRTVFGENLPSIFYATKWATIPSG